MFVVRYVALATLVISLGGTIRLVAVKVFGDVVPPFPLIAAGCGLIILVCLFIMKFVGPPPRAFVTRAALAFLMMVLALYAAAFDPGATVLSSLMAINMALGLILLVWYAHE